LHLLDLRVLGKQARVARRVLASLIENHELAVEADRRAGHQRLAVLHAGAVDGVARGEVVRAVEHDIGAGDELGKVFDSLVQWHDFDVGVHRAERRARRLDLHGADRFRAVKDLPLQVGQVDLVGIRQRQLADSSGSEVERRRAAEAARADDQRARGAQLLLPLDPDLGEQDVPAVPEKLLVVQVAENPLGKPSWSAWASACRSGRPSATGSSPARP